MSGRKRPRPSDAAEKAAEKAKEDEIKALCPFNAIVVDLEREQKKKKRRKTSEASDEPKVPFQTIPFRPSGSFKTHQTLDVHYKVLPGKDWSDMTRYNSFVLNNQKYFSEGFVFVANEASIERQKNLASDKGVKYSLQRAADDWVGRILEIRAADEHHVFARLVWMYWPDELPKGTRDGNKVVTGRQPYHGSRELVASNHMDIINVVSVTAPADVNHWLEENDAEIQEGLFWRQAFDVRTYELSSVFRICKCNQPANPDDELIGCTTEGCKKWLHQPCIRHEALMRTYEQLGRDKPHVSAESKDKPATQKTEEVEPPMSPVESGAAASAQESIGVAHSSTNDEATTSSGNPKVEAEKKPATKPTVANGDSKAKAKDQPHPYEGLFDVYINIDEETKRPQLVFKDLRTDVVGGDKEWAEPLNCLVCGNVCT